MGVSRTCSWRLPDGPGCQLGGYTMGVQLAVARWARLAAGVHNGHAAGGCPMGQAGGWAGALWACSWRLSNWPGWQLEVHYGHAMAIPARCRGCRTQMVDMQGRSISHTNDKGKPCCSNHIYIQISYKHSIRYAHIQGIICHMIYL